MTIGAAEAAAKRCSTADSGWLVQVTVRVGVAAGKGVIAKLVGD